MWNVSLDDDMTYWQSSHDPEYRLARFRVHFHEKFTVINLNKFKASDSSKLISKPSPMSIQSNEGVHSA